MSLQEKLPDAIDDLLSHINYEMGEQLQNRIYTILGEVENINPKIYGGNQYIQIKSDNTEIQMVVPSLMCGGMKKGYIYRFQGYFSVSSNINFGAFQFIVSSVEEYDKSDTLKSRELAEKKILSTRDGYKYDFIRLQGKTTCKVALVTSIESQAVRDVEYIFSERNGLTFEVIDVHLFKPSTIVEEIRLADQGDYDVIMIVRGGGKDNHFYVFEDEKVIDAIKNAKTPIITGIGHAIIEH